MNHEPHNYVAAVFDSPDKAIAFVEDLNKHDFLMDQVSILHRAGGLGDDFLGIAYTDEKQRFKVWGAAGALWGSLGGLLAGAAGLFLLPGIGPVLIAGPILDAIVGAAVGAGLMTTGGCRHAFNNWSTATGYSRRQTSAAASGRYGWQNGGINALRQ